MTKKTYEYGRELASAIIQEAGRLEKQATMTHEETQAHLIAWGEQSARLAKRRQDFLRDHPGDQAARHAVNIAHAADKHIDSVFDSVRAMQSRQDSLRGTPGEHLHGEDDHPEYDTGLSESAHAKIGRVRRAAGIRRSLATHIADNSRFYGRVAAGVGGAAIGGLALGGAYGAKRYADHVAESKTLMGRAKKGLSEVRKAIGRNPKLALGLGAGTLAVGGAGVALHEHQKKAALFVDLVDGGYSLAEAASLIKQASRLI